MKINYVNGIAFLFGLSIILVNRPNIQPFFKHPRNNSLPSADIDKIPFQKNSNINYDLLSSLQLSNVNVVMLSSVLAEFSSLIDTEKLRIINNKQYPNIALCQILTEIYGLEPERPETIFNVSTAMQFDYSHFCELMDNDPTEAANYLNKILNTANYQYKLAIFGEIKRKNSDLLMSLFSFDPKLVMLAPVPETEISSLCDFVWLNKPAEITNLIEQFPTELLRTKAIKSISYNYLSTDPENPANLIDWLPTMNEKLGGLRSWLNAKPRSQSQIESVLSVFTQEQNVKVDEILRIAKQKWAQIDGKTK